MAGDLYAAIEVDCWHYRENSEDRNEGAGALEEFVVVHRHSYAVGRIEVVWVSFLVFYGLPHCLTGSYEVAEGAFV